jgi:hypothetical protein
MMHRVRGAGCIVQEHRTAQWRVGQTTPFFASFDAKLSFDCTFEQKSVRLDMDRLESLGVRWLGARLTSRCGLICARSPMSFSGIGAGRSLMFGPSTQAFCWSSMRPRQNSTNTCRRCRSATIRTITARNSWKTAPTLIPGIVRRAERFMIDNVDKPITVSDVTDYLGVGLRTLQAGFRQWRSSTPNAFLRQTRLQFVRDALRCRTPKPI